LIARAPVDGGMASTAMTVGSSVAPMRQRQTMEFPYKHSTGETVGRFLAALKGKKIWGQRVNGRGGRPAARLLGGRRFYRWRVG
jgi:hypothetical protein